MEKLPDRIDSKFRFVLLAAARAEQMIHGGSEKRESEGPKVTRLAMTEISTDEVEWDYGPAPEPDPETAEGEEDAGAGESAKDAEA